MTTTLTTETETFPTNANPNQTQQLPVIIVGAGPCGLVAGLALKKYGIPFVIIEKASRSKICSNAGSGFELAPTAVEILEHRLGIDVTDLIFYYQGFNMMTMEGKDIRHAVMPPGYKGGSVNRAEMQNKLLKILFPSAESEDGVLVCGSGIDTFTEYPNENKVVATLCSGQTITGCVLLACDGIHSRCRAVMHGGYDNNQDWATNAKKGETLDPLHFCNARSYWGKTPAPRGTDLEVLFAETQTAKGGKPGSCQSPVVMFPTTRAPSSFFIVPSKGGTMLNWAVTIQTDTERMAVNNDGKDLTRRGGGALTEDDKKIIFDFTSHDKDSKSVVRGVKDWPLIEKLIEQTPAADITEAGLFDRTNLNLPYSSESKLVALLGDAAHPQTPFLGQGVNMAITDAYIYATNIALALKKNSTKSLSDAISDSDTTQRRKEAKNVVRQARFFCNLFTSPNIIMIWIMWLYAKLAPMSEIMNQVENTDKSNAAFLKSLDEKQCSVNEQMAMHQTA